MWMMTLRVCEMNDEWTVRRKESVKPMEIEEGLVVGGRTMGAALAPASEKLLNPAVNEGGLGMYEPHSNCIFCEFCRPRSLKRKLTVLLVQIAPTPSPLQVVGKLSLLSPRQTTQRVVFLGEVKSATGHGAWHGLIPSWSLQEGKTSG